MKKLIASILMSTMLLLSLASCAGSTVDSQPTSEATDSTDSTQEPKKMLIEEGKLYAATSPDYPPFEFLDGTEITGFDVELLNAVAENVGLEVIWDKLSFETIVTAVGAGQYDVGMSAFSYDSDREVLFSDSYYNSSQIALLPADSEITTLEELQDGKLAAGMGTTGEPAARKLSDDVALIPTSSGFPALLAGQIDSYICDYGVAINAVATGKYKMIEEPIEEESFSIIMKEDNQALCDLLNQSLAEYMETQEYQDLLAKYELN